MDIQDHFRALGLHAGASHDEVVCAYRRRALKIAEEREGDHDDQENRQARLSIEQSFLILNEIASRGTHKSDNAGRAHGPLWLESEVFRFQRTTPRPLNLEFSPAKAPIIPSLTTARVSDSKKVGGGSPSLASSLAIGSIIVLITIIILSLARDEKAPAPSPTEPQPAASVAIPEGSTATSVEATNREAPLVELSGRLIVRANRANAKMEILPREAERHIAIAQIDPTTFSVTSLPPGEYRLIASLNGWPAIEKNITIRADRLLETEVAFRGGTLRLDSDPSNAVVRVGGTVMGKTPIVLSDLPPGNLVVSLQYDWWPETQIARTISAGRELNESYRIPRGRLTVASSPPGTVFLAGGRELGKTPIVFEHFPVGAYTLQLRADDHVTKDFPIVVTGDADLQIQPLLVSSLPELDPNALLVSAWRGPPVSGRKYEIAPGFESDKGSKPKNGIIRNLDRVKVDAAGLRQKFRYEGTVKNFDAKSGLIEFEDGSGEKSKYRVTAQLSDEARRNGDFTTRLVRGVIVQVSGRLSAVEEPRWPSKTISLELTEVRPVNGG